MKPFFVTDTERRGSRARLREIVREQSLAFGNFTLASGATSHFYIDLRRTTTHPEGAYLVATLLLDRLRDDWPDAAGGPTIGADPIAGALATMSHLHGNPLPTFIVRSATKDHGTQKRVEGHLKTGDRVILLDDVITRGGSLVQAIRAVRELGAEVQKVMTILNRNAGGDEVIANEGLTIDSILELHDIVTVKEQEGAHA